MPENLFFLAVIPPEPLYTSIENLKHTMSDRFHSKHALKSPPHITVIPPFWYDANEIKELYQSVSERASSFLPIEIELQNFNCFRPRVIYVDVLDPTNRLRDLNEALKSHFLKGYNLTPDKRDVYRPHCTIGFKDLTPKMFYQAWDYFKKQEFNASFKTRDVALLQHEQGRWKVV